MWRRVPFVVAILGLASPTWAQGGEVLPETPNLTIIGLGILGVFIGRFIAMRGRGD